MIVCGGQYGEGLRSRHVRGFFIGYCFCEVASEVVLAAFGEGGDAAHDLGAFPVVHAGRVEVAEPFTSARLTSPVALCRRRTCFRP